MANSSNNSGQRYKSGSGRKTSGKKKKSSVKEKIIIAASIIAGIVIIAVMVLNIPIIPVERTKNGLTFTEHISIIKWIKELQPMAETEGLLSADPNSYELNSAAEGVDDKRDFTNDQIIEGQFTVLCLGFDESRSNSDVIMLFHFDIVNDKINILQIPRDSFVPDYTSSENGKINSVYTLGDENLIPIQRIVDAVRDTFGIPIDRYITTGCDDIVDMVDLIGGIPIDLPEDVFYSYDKILYAGEQVLNGEQAELFVRARKGYLEGDIGRVKAQRIFMAACMEKALNMGTVELTKFLTEVYNKGYIGTDLTLQEMSILADFGSNMDLDDVTVQMVPGEATDYNGYSVWSIHKNATIDVLNEYFRPYQPDLTYDSLPITELIESDYYTTDVYDENQDTLQEIADGATPGESKKTTEPSSEYDDTDNDYDDGNYEGEWYYEDEGEYDEEEYYEEDENYHTYIGGY
ncbi:LCP family protein [Porcipelethomonas sp.]|uniref:LCP family protein n=1 Tax=Porcipelethomonas sp. TaxID=2981675 RepID=UPI003EF707AF